MIRAHAPHSAPYRTVLLISLAAAAWFGTSGVDARAQRSNQPPTAALTRLTSLGFSRAEARCLLITTQTRPGTVAGAYSAQRIAMAVLYGDAHAFGSPGHHPARRPNGASAAPCAAFPPSWPTTAG